jgi:hypothetical protein
LSKAKLVWKSGFCNAPLGTMTERAVPVGAVKGETVEAGVTEEMLKSPVWLVGHSYLSVRVYASTERSSV